MAPSSDDLSLVVTDMPDRNADALWSMKLPNSRYQLSQPELT
jgi:hypothetical protein